ncbi:MAG TPA: CysB family HTH-type transcriptional regulator [Accumulibacter sp.]|uniref:CysB family HTH-type transcriptional regulator n=1 Tax=Accumulibacter sp. TaxID=2053492 RepID=UPI002878C885|nr:CysB family HTH-type transcriptional regulator [Accumulibacter sp.]MDS4054053.1 CysB family HTH-type transcriptional regulator [Accumulibacter sp.]HMV05327.1 CysB family HTH-type transcriptional regulator [Accumulibacter sp.]HMW62293.1 CysB family HTH-type transcriptional regulator [Accumulibacter sp.]HMW79357.1 CysB family HTH-type transcriptional regulator [Accumulibacter sp.]HNB69087.1 CysB family HTH-type transcriptional regulator [Accumulibacter sp.]
MNFQQLRIIRETVRQEFNLTEVANALYTSQSGVSKHIKDLEDELGIEIFVRRGKRLLGLTEPGKDLVGVVERILLDTQNLRRIADQFASRETGHFVVATTHTQARYALPTIIKWFKADYPKVHLTLLQGSPGEIADLLVSGRADVGIATESLDTVPELTSFPFYSWHHAIIVPHGHPLLAAGGITLETLGDYPLITYHEGFTGRAKIDQAFSDAGVVPDIVLSAIDADVIKTYVGLGLGVGIVASVAYDAEQDRNLALIPVPDLFPANTTRLAARRGIYLRSYAHAFIEKVCPDLGEETIKAALRSQQNGGAD